MAQFMCLYSTLTVAAISTRLNSSFLNPPKPKGILKNYDIFTKASIQVMYIYDISIEQLIIYGVCRFHVFATRWLEASIFTSCCKLQACKVILYLHLQVSILFLGVNIRGCANIMSYFLGLLNILTK